MTTLLTSPTRAPTYPKAGGGFLSQRSSSPDIRVAAAAAIY
jgi:hypothetical protein